MQSWAGMSHELIPITGEVGTGSRNLMMDAGGMRRAPRRAFNETSEKETVWALTTLFPTRTGLAFPLAAAARISK